MAASTSVGSSRWSSARVSTRTGRAPVRKTAFSVAAKLLAGKMTSVPGPAPSANRTAVIASVPLEAPIT
ncbi:Uncharacterised protein [Mycobacteroides abscessus subsp. abscessus]|nr:Uncharacterised protein [Mycobacteroides abscessus subsp. abscessus]SKV23573.1 Uncharacterised protein [Mycobacteroides abscessus subsp. abscessus]